jgi:DNA-binding transcriptional LysR family regulator
MELRQLRTFRTVATLLSFNRAAEALNYAQSTVSAQIRTLEEDLGVKLFDRLGKGIVLTEAGELLSQHAQKMLDMEAETLADVKGRNRPQGSLTIRVPQSIGNTYVPEVLSRFRERFPLVSFQFQTCAFHSLEHELLTGVTDLAFLLAESIRSANLVAEPLRFERLLMVSNPGNPLASASCVAVKDLADHAVFLPKFDCGYRMAFEQVLAERNVKPRTILEFNSMDMLKSCLKCSEGVAMIPGITVQREVDRGELAAVPWEEEDLETAILMIRHKDKWLSPALQAFMETARSVIREDGAASP